MKKIILSSILLIYVLYGYCQDKKYIMDLLIKSYEDYYNLNNTNINEEPLIESICLAEPEGFDSYFQESFIISTDLTRGRADDSFSFNDSLHSPLTRDLILTSEYGMRGKRKHNGVDFLVNEGDSICSIFCGKVRLAMFDESYGYVVVIRHYNMSETVYAHLSKILVDKDQDVEVGEVIGLGGNTGRSEGSHLHFELRYRGIYPINPVVERKFLKKIKIINN